VRTTLIIAVSVIAGVAIGLVATMAELGIAPDGGSAVKFGYQAMHSLPDIVNKPGEIPKAAVAANDLEYNFGKADKEAKGRHEFVVRNDGNGKLSLAKGETSCVCTVSAIDRNILAPGESAHVTLEWHAKTLGPFRQSATIITNDTSRPVIEFSVAGEYVATVRVTPDEISFNGLAPDEPVTREVRIISFAPTPLEVTNPTFSDHTTAKFFAVNLEKLSVDELKQEEGAKSGWLAKVVIKPGLPAGTFEQKITLNLNLPEKPTAEITVEGKVNGPMELTGGAGANWDAEHNMLMLGEVQSQEGAKAQLFVTVRGEMRDRVKLAVGEVSADSLRVSLGEPQKISATVTRRPVLIEVPRGSRPVDHLGNDQGHLAYVTLKTGLAEPAELRFSVRYIVEQ
jgi:hypothetical protein